MTPKERIRKIFSREKPDRLACFSGMGNVTVEGLKKYDYAFYEIHLDAEKMANAACSSYELYGFECAVAPFDLGVEAEVLGAEMNFYTHKGKEDIVYPTVKKKAINEPEDLNVPEKIEEKGRVPLVLKALEIMQKRVGEEVPIATYILGPYTLAGQIMDLEKLLKMSFKNPDRINELLSQLTDFLAELGRIYQDAGIDYLTVREMGAPTDVLSPRMFKNLILPHLKELFLKLKEPTVLHICGDTNMIVELMWQSGATAISVEQKNDVAKTREKLGEEAIIFGNIDPYGTLVLGTPEDIRNAVKKAIVGGVSSVWPGCDIWPAVSKENMLTFVEAVKEFGKLQ
ncbi:methyltransferase MtaA/CmuA family [Ferroglobus placidus DSM 10642]|uniref:Methyltransferase MtaA/CmuA family n=1 Tax=Ferroglobus placidus (strain DSM 10642 / AEDII12DO) TaxID=589924 RepID=D3RZH7_FERPA|nr:MtaA/CmuA family methyltransferase [Ferroglobus placidus]ADC65890.1 methyltransferase MtaA/CmuA family [Ferroglobus placidus DSM 10642]